MGGMFQHKEFSDIDVMMDFIKEQIKCANNCGLYLMHAEIKQVGVYPYVYVWFAYFSK